MKNGLMYQYNTRNTTLEEGVCEAFAKYYRMFGVFPHVLRIPRSDVGYRTDLLEVRLDANLKPGMLWLGAGG